MSNFSKAKKYYTKSEMEQQIRTLLSSSEMKIADLSSKIVGYLAKIEKQEKEISELKKRERIIKNALFLATDQSKVAFEEAIKTKSANVERLEKLKNEYSKRIAELDSVLAKDFDDKIEDLVSDFRSGIGAGELARRRELEIAKKKMEEANKKNIDAQKSIEERYKAVLEKYQALQSKSKEEEFSIEEALNPTSSLEEIMKEIFKK